VPKRFREGIPFFPHLAVKRYWRDGGSKSLDEILEEYRQARRKKRDQMWFLYIDLRKDFDDIERDSDKDLDVSK